MGSGHVGPFERVARRFLDDGWRVVLIVRDLSRVHPFFEPGEVEAWQAPFKISRAVPHVPHPDTFGHMLLNLGYRHEGELRQLVDAWRLLFHQLRPDLLVFDHSPTAMLAARGMAVPQATIGHGFFVPVDEDPLRPLAPWKQVPLEQRRADERELVDRINCVLSHNRQP